MSDSKIILIPKVTIHPTKICLYSEVKWLELHSKRVNDENEQEELSEVSKSFLHSARRNNGFLSDNAKRSLFKAIDYLLITSDQKKVYSKLQRKYITFRIVFVTLTLPSAQIHDDKTIHNKCFNQLLIELGKYHNINKYVWRAEKQENGNLHYHLLINEFIEYQELRKRWNRICNKLGYVDRYEQNMRDFYKNGFRISQNKNDKRSVADQRKSYIIGQKSGWRSPNSTDIHNTKKVRNIKRYVAKYMAKQPDVQLDSIQSDEDLNIVRARLWSCSHNLSNLKGCQLDKDWQISEELDKVFEKGKCHIYSGSYFKVMFINATDLLSLGSELLFKYFSDYLVKQFNYHLQTQLL